MHATAEEAQDEKCARERFAGQEREKCLYNIHFSMKKYMEFVDSFFVFVKKGLLQVSFAAVLSFETYVVLITILCKLF